MRYVCSRCHSAVEADPEAEHFACPNCQAEAGIEAVKDETPPAMQYFGVVLLVAAIATIGGSLFGL